MATTTHRIKWFVYAGDKKIRRESTMRGTWAYDVECSCGWITRTGGATLSAIRLEIWLHKIYTRDSKVGA